MHCKQLISKVQHVLPLVLNALELNTVSDDLISAGCSSPRPKQTLKSGGLS